MESLQIQEELKAVLPKNPGHPEYIAIYVENLPKMDLAFRGSIRIVYNDENKELIIMIHEE
jgi:hypothetical protein